MVASPTLDAIRFQDTVDQWQSVGLHCFMILELRRNANATELLRSACVKFLTDVERFWKLLQNFSRVKSGMSGTACAVSVTADSKRPFMSLRRKCYGGECVAELSQEPVFNF
jgi:hypothetical protein